MVRVPGARYTSYHSIRTEVLLYAPDTYQDQVPDTWIRMISYTPDQTEYHEIMSTLFSPLVHTSTRQQTAVYNSRYNTGGRNAGKSGVLLGRAVVGTRNTRVQHARHRAESPQVIKGIAARLG